MRTTIDLPPELHQRARALAHDTSQTLSHVIAELMRDALDAPHGTTARAAVQRDEKTGFPTITLGKTITTEDVRALEDEIS